MFKRLLAVLGLALLIACEGNSSAKSAGNTPDTSRRWARFQAQDTLDIAYLDTLTVVRTDSERFTAWSKYEYHTAQRLTTGPDARWYFSTLERSKMDCARFLWQLLQVRFYDSARVQVGDLSPTALAWVRVVPTSDAERTLSAVCKWARLHNLPIVPDEPQR